MLRFGIRWGMAITLVFLVMVTDGHAQRLLETDGIELRGTARVVTYGAAVCNVVEASHTEAKYEQIKANHGQPLDVWQLDFSIYNGSGKWLDHLIARYGIESKWPPCTNWSGLSGSYAKPVEWAGSFQVLGRPYEMEAGEEVSDTIFLLVFHEHQPVFEDWKVNFTFGESTSAPESNADAARAASLPGPPQPTPSPSADRPAAAPAEVRNSVGMEFVRIPPGVLDSDFGLELGTGDTRIMRQTKGEYA